MTGKKVVTSVLVAGLSISAMGFYLFTPSKHYSLDVNPSVEIQTNRLDKVTSIKGVNEDGRKLLKGYEIDGQSLDDVVEDVVDRMADQGYLEKEHNARILVTGDSPGIKKEELDLVNDNIELYLGYIRAAAKVSGQIVKPDASLVEEAQKHQISIGKMSVIKRLLEGDKTLKAEELSKASIKDILQYAKDKNIPLDLLEDRIDDMDDDRMDRLEHAIDTAEDAVDDKYDNDADDRYDDKYDDDLDDRYDDKYDDDADDRYDDDHDDDADDRNDHDDDRDDDHDDHDDRDDD